MTVSWKLVVAATTLGIAVLAIYSPLTLINVLSRTDAQVTRAVAYGEGPRRLLDVYSPPGARDAPTVVFFYGGSWNSGERADYEFVGRALASRGIVAVIADYRLYPEVRFPDFLDDAAQAVVWALRHARHFGGDPHQVFVMGHSAGAYNAAMVALDARWLEREGFSPATLRGWIGLAGPYDFLPILNPSVKPVFFAPQTPPDSQPINHVSGSAPPALLIAPRDDALVDPKRNTGGLARRLRASGVPVQEFYYGRVSHQTLVGSIALPLRVLAPTLDAIQRFVAKEAAHPPHSASNEAEPAEQRARAEQPQQVDLRAPHQDGGSNRYQPQRPVAGRVLVGASEYPSSRQQ